MNRLVSIIIVVTVVLSARYIGGLVYRDYQIKHAENVTTSYTKAEYMQEVRKKTSDPGMLCAYEKLIDQYGTSETLKIDLRVMANVNDVDPRIYTALNECL